MRLPERAPTFGDMLKDGDLMKDLPRVIARGLGPLVDGRYMRWDSIRRRTPPVGLSHQQWWLGITLARQPTLREIPLLASDGRPFRYSLPDPVLELLHWIDQHAAGELVVSEAIKEPGDRQRYLVNSLIEEAITSSQLEGASATRRVAKEMLRTGRPPRDRAERMIRNNYQAMTVLRDLAAAPLTLGTVFDLHQILTAGTLDNPDAAGRLQRVDEQRVHVEASDGTIAHMPPPAVELPEPCSTARCSPRGTGCSSTSRFPASCSKHRSNMDDRSYTHRRTASMRRTSCSTTSRSCGVRSRSSRTTWSGRWRSSVKR